MTSKLPISFEAFYDNCRYATVWNEVLAERVPFASYAHSWDAMNYSFQVGTTRGTVTFDLARKVLVGAMRDELCSRTSWYPDFDAVSLLGEAP
ncbi:MAG: hypothetical protein LBD25_00025, partial [Coriobacteriales bacterium]|nr:hypothetical protein [Coriobacteriales bacterium]